MPNNYWIIGLFALFFVVIIVATITGRGLSAKKRKLRYEKFILAGVLMPLAIFLFFVIPFVKPSYISHISSRDKPDYPQSLSSNEEIAKYIKNHYRQIENLEEEVTELREELYQTHKHYSFVLQILMTVFLSYGFTRLFSSEKKEESEN